MMKTNIKMTETYGNFNLTWNEEEEMLILRCKGCNHSVFLPYEFLIEMGREASGRLVVKKSKK